MSKIFYIIIIILINIIKSLNKINTYINNISNSTNNERFLQTKNKKQNDFFKNKIVRISLIVGSLLLGIIGGIIYAIYCYGFDPTYYDWEFIWREVQNRRRQRKRKKLELLKKKQKFYLLNSEIKSIDYKKDICNNEEECPICLENYSNEKDVCFTPCKHLFHHNCLKEYIYGCEEMKCPICKFDMWDCLKDKNINYSKIKIKEEIFEIKKTNKKNNLINSNNETINSNNISTNNENDNLNIPVDN